jgi:hypothetical protein
MIQGTIPPSGPPADAQIGVGPLVGDPSMLTAPQRHTSVVPGDSFVPSQRNSSERGAQRDRSRLPSKARQHHDIREHDNIPMAMPVRASRSGERLRRGVEHQQDSAASSSRGHRINKQKILGPVESKIHRLVTSVRGEPSAPPPPEGSHESLGPGSPPTDGQSDIETPRQPKKTHESPIELRRRLQAINRVVEATQSFVGGYPDMQALVGSVSSTNVSNTPRPLSERRAKTNNL